jgi:outer membrane protein assembly factor BamB
MMMIQMQPGTPNPPATTIWDLSDVHFYAMNMLCRGSGIIFAHTCDWTDDISAEKGGMYYVSAIDSFNGRVIWRIPLGRGVNYCHEYGGLYFNRNGSLYIGTNQYLCCIKNFESSTGYLKEVTQKIDTTVLALD